MGLALSLRRLDLIEMIFLTSRSSSSAPSSSTRPSHDESLLRYVLHEILSGYGGSQELPKEFVTEVSRRLLRIFAELYSLALRPPSSSFQSEPQARLQLYHFPMGPVRLFLCVRRGTWEPAQV